MPLQPVQEGEDSSSSGESIYFSASSNNDDDYVDSRDDGHGDDDDHQEEGPVSSRAGRDPAMADLWRWWMGLLVLVG